MGDRSPLYVIAGEKSPIYIHTVRISYVSCPPIYSTAQVVVCIVTLAPPTTATVTFNVAIIARWGRCQLRGDAGCPIAESLLSILDDEVLSQNA